MFFTLLQSIAGTKIGASAANARISRSSHPGIAKAEVRMYYFNVTLR
jgi:hypothetical protein